MSLCRRSLFVLAGAAVASILAVTFSTPAFAKGKTPPPATKPAPTPPPSKPKEEKPKDLIDTLTASTDPVFKALLEGIKVAELTTTLKGHGPFTLFAPTDAAFAKMDAAKLAELMKPANKAKLKALLNYHVVAQKLMAADIAKLKELKTVNGAMLTVKLADDKSWTVDEQKPSKLDVVVGNGIIHFMDAVLAPKEPTPPAAPTPDPSMGTPPAPK